MTELKSKLYQHCLNFINTRVETASIALQQAREAANDDTKSSAGDKYETTREMMQQEVDRNKRLLIDAQQQQYVLSKITNSEPSADIQHGSLVFTNQGNFYISISAGQLTLDKKIYFAVSPSSPIGTTLLGKKEGDSFDFNGKKYKVVSVV